MRTLQRLVILVAGIGMATTAGCSESSTEPTLLPIEGTWRGTARSDTLLLQLVEKPWDEYTVFTVFGTGTYTEAATGSNSTFGLFGSRAGLTVDIIMDSQPNVLNYRASVEENRLVGVLWVLLRNRTGDRIVLDSIPLIMTRQ